MGISIGDNLQYFLFAQHILFAYKGTCDLSSLKYVLYRMLTHNGYVCVYLIQG